MVMVCFADFASAAPVTYLRRMELKKTLICLLLIAAISFVYSPLALAQAAAAQGSTASNGQVVSDQDIKLMREDIRAHKKQLVAANLTLTADEATKFWPVYDQYTAELVKINDTKYAAIKEYAEHWGTMTNEQALSLAKRSIGVEESVAQLRTRYIPIFNKVIPGTKVATFFQIDRRLQLLIDAQLASQIPLVQDQK